LSIRYIILRDIKPCLEMEVEFLRKLL
jgi:hypothetical protein